MGRLHVWLMEGAGKFSKCFYENSAGMRYDISERSHRKSTKDHSLKIMLTASLVTTYSREGKAYGRHDDDDTLMMSRCKEKYNVWLYEQPICKD